MSFTTRLTSIIASLGLLPALLTQCNQGVREAPLRILFVGNSLSSWNGGVDRNLQLLAASATPARQIEVDTVYRDGATLSYLWQEGTARHRLKDAHFDYLVLQEDLPEGAPASSVGNFLQAADYFHQAAHAQGTQVIFQATWSYRRLAWMTWPQILRAHEDAAKHTQARLSLVGAAVQDAENLQPPVKLLQEDQEHPNQAGTYLSALVLYATLFPTHSTPLPWRPWGMSQQEAETLQVLAKAQRP